MLDRPFFHFSTVSENEVNSPTIVSAVSLPNPEYRKRIMDAGQCQEREISTYPRMAFSDVHLGGLRSMSCLRSRNAVETAFMDQGSPASARLSADC